MSPLLYEIIVYSVEALLSGIFLINMLEEKYHKVLHVALWCEIVIIAMLCTSSFSVFRIGLMAFLEFVYTYFMFEDKPKKRVRVYLFKELLLLTASVASYAVYSLCIDDHATYLSSCRSDNCTYCLLYLLMFSVLISIVFQFTKERKGVEFPWVIGTQVVIGFGEATAILAVATASDGVINSRNSWFIIVATVCMIAANISIGMLAPYLLRKVTLSTNMDYGKELSNMEYKYYEMSVENNKKLRAIRHDISNHIQTAYSLFSNGETQRGIELINELRARYALVEQMVYCNNPVVNIILSNKKNTPAEDCEVFNTLSIDASAEAIQAVAETQGGVYKAEAGATVSLHVDTCFDVSVYGILKFGLTDSSYAAKFIGGKVKLTCTVFSSKNAKFFNYHVDNWNWTGGVTNWGAAANQSTCTLQYKPFDEEPEATTPTESIEATESNDISFGEFIVLSDFRGEVAVGGKYCISITQLPAGYSMSDIVYESADKSIAKVNIKSVATQIKREEDAAAAAARAAAERAAAERAAAARAEAARANQAKQQKINAAQSSYDKACRDLDTLKNQKKQLEKDIKKANIFTRWSLQNQLDELNKKIKTAESKVQSTYNALRAAKG